MFWKQGMKKWVEKILIHVFWDSVVRALLHLKETAEINIERVEGETA